MRTIDEERLASKVNELYNDVMQYKTSQVIGSSCSKVFDLEHNVGNDFSGAFFNEDSTTPSYRSRGVLVPSQRSIALIPMTRTNHIGPNMVRVDGTIEGVDLKTLAQKGLLGMSYSQPGQAFELGMLNNSPITRTLITKIGCQMRYIKVGINGNSENNSNHWVEIQAYCGYGPDGTSYLSLGNVARGKTVTGQSVSSTTNISRVTDGTITASSYYDGGSGGYRTVTVDLGQNYYVDTILVWLYYGDGRTYNSFTVSTGTSNVSGTADLADVWVKNQTSIVNNGFVWTDDANCQYAQLIRTGGHANLKFVIRNLDDGAFKIENVGKLIG